MADLIPHQALLAGSIFLSFYCSLGHMLTAVLMSMVLTYTVTASSSPPKSDGFQAQEPRLNHLTVGPACLFP